MFLHYNYANDQIDVVSMRDMVSMRQIIQIERDIFAMTLRTVLTLIVLDILYNSSNKFG